MIVLSANDIPDGPQQSVVVFRTMPDHLNSNKDIEQSLSKALQRKLGGAQVIRASSEVAASAIQVHRPRLAIGIGSVAMDIVDLAAIRRAARTCDATLVYWLHDDPYEIDFAWKIRGNCDWVFNTDRASVEIADFDEISHLPLAADREKHIRPIKPHITRYIDAFFCGVAYPNRKAIIESSRDILSVYQTVVRGSHWDEGFPFCRNERISASSLIDYYTDSKVVLNIGRHFNIANRQYEIVPSTPGPRTFEAAGAGCVQAVFLESLEIFDFFHQHTEIVTFSSVNELSDILERSRDCPTEMQAIATASQRRVLNEHTYDHRVVEMLDLLKRQSLLNFV